MSQGLIGPGLDRVDGRLKVTGQARYSAEVAVPNLVHAVLVQSTVARGTLMRLEVSEAERSPGVLGVLTPANAPVLPGWGSAYKPSLLEPWLSLLQDNEVRYYGQPLAVVVAHTFEQAHYAARRVRARYQERPPALVLEEQLANAYPPTSMLFGQTADYARGDVAAGMAAAAVRVEGTYYTPHEHHHPLEPHATVAVWEEGPRLTVHDTSQAVANFRRYLALLFGLPPESVRVLSPFVGGGFGSKARMWSHVVLTAMAARMVGRPVKLVLTRQQMTGLVGSRPETLQHLALGADAQGRLTAVEHTGYVHVSEKDEYVENVAASTRLLYACPNLKSSVRGVRLHTGSPNVMRAPGEAQNLFALESAMDELAWALRLDPLELRVRNHAEVDPRDGRPWSSKSLLQCYQQGAERFGWAQRPLEPRSLREGSTLIGWGMATASYPTIRLPASARAVLRSDGTALVQSATHELGTGTYTVMAQVAAQELGLAPEQVRFELGDTQLPAAPLSAASMTVASVGSAVKAAAAQVRLEVVRRAVADTASPLYGLPEQEVAVEAGRMYALAEPSRGETYAALLARQGLPEVESLRSTAPGSELSRYSMHAFGAHFAEVRVDEELGTVRVSRYVAAFASGRILNAKTARSQAVGGIIMGLGMALMEETVMDRRTGYLVTRDLADYHVPTHADIPPIDVLLVEEEDAHVNPLGAKGIGELPTAGVAAAVANALFHATGKRLRELPFTPDALL